MQLRHLPIQRKLIVIIFFTTLTVLLGSYLLLFYYESRRSERTTVQSLKTMADIIAANSTAALIYDDPKLAEEIISGLRAEPDITAAALFDKQGKLYAVYPAGQPASAFPAAPGPDGAAFGFQALVLYQPVIEGTDRVGTLFIKSNLGGMYRRLRVYGWVLVGVLIGGVLLTFPLSNFLQRQISQPILHLAETARIVSEQKDYSVRARKRSGDELGFVTEAFNAMLEQIQLNHAELLNDAIERQHVATELKRARDEAVNASRAKDDFLAALSHELRTPLNPILLLATDAVNNPDLAPAVRGDFDTVRKNVELEARLIDDLLDLTSITSGKLALKQQAVDVHAVIRDAVATIQAELTAKRIELVLEFAAENPVVRGDPIRLQQVFWNVLKNAAKFTLEQGKVTIVTAPSADGKELVVKVRDTGIGISPEEMPHVFEAFSQGDHARGVGYHRFGGLGLGLAISRKMIELHSGRIYAESAGRNQGSTFSIDLPLAGAAAPTGPAAAAGASQSAAPAAAAPAARRSVLLVEDHAPTRRVLEQLLQRKNYRVLAAASLAEARGIVENEKFDFVISDIGLPDGNGYELMTELAQRFRVKGIALTGYGMESDIARSHATGFIAHLTKPVSVSALDAAIAATIPAG